MSKKHPTHREYAWKMDLFGIDANLVAHRVYDLTDKLGHYPSLHEIADDRNVASSPFSELLTVEPEEAKEVWRKQRIRTIFNQLRIAKNKKPTRTRGFYFVQPSDKDVKRFVPAAAAYRQSPMREQIFIHAYRYYENAYARFATDKSMKEFLPLINQLRKKMEEKMRKQMMAGIGG